MIALIVVMLLHCDNLMRVCLFRLAETRGASLGVHANVYNWIGNSLLGGSKSPKQVEHFIVNVLLRSSMRFSVIEKELTK